MKNLLPPPKNSPFFILHSSILFVSLQRKYCLTIHNRQHQMSSFDFKNELTWRDFLIRAVLVIGTVAIIVWLMPRSTQFSFNAEKGRPWVYSDLSAP